MDGTTVPEAREFTISCLPSGDNSAPSACHPVICGVPPAVTFGYHEADPLAALAFGAELSYKCQDGYSLDGNKAGETELSIKCTADGLFEETLGCFPKMCGAPPSVGHASFDAGERVSGESVLYVCDDGYTSSGTMAGLTEFSIACEANGMYP